MGVLEWEVIFVLIDGLNWISVLVYLWREWWPLLHLILRCGLLSHRLLNRLLCGLICGSNGFNVVHSDVVDESRLTAILREDDLRLMTETDLYRYARRSMYTPFPGMWLESNIFIKAKKWCFH